MSIECNKCYRESATGPDLLCDHCRSLQNSGITEEQPNRMDSFRALLPDPGPEVTGQLISEIRRLRQTLTWIAGQQNLFFAECSQAEEIIVRCKEALGSYYDSPAIAAECADFYNGVEWLACWLLDNKEGETITEEQLRPWAVEAWKAHLKRQPDSR